MTLSGQRVLVIDDDPAYCKILCESLQILGCQAEASRSLSEAQERINNAANNGTPFAVATIDMRFVMGTQNLPLGQQMIQFIKQHHPYIACIMVSGSGVTADEVLDLRDKYDLDYFVEKDRLDLDRLKGAIERATSRVANAHKSAGSEPLPQTDRRFGQPSVFISYSRRYSWGAARAIANSLRERRLNVFLDLDEINVGRFKNVIEQEIESREFFVPILTPETLESEWVQTEIARALVLKKKIIPLLCDDLQLDKLELPVLLRDLATFNAIAITPTFYDTAIQKLTDWCYQHSGKPLR